jgi:hypothetical protein
MSVIIRYRFSSVKLPSIFLAGITHAIFGRGPKTLCSLLFAIPGLPLTVTDSSFFLAVNHASWTFA